MKKKSLFSIALSLGMVLTMATPTFAANTNTNVNADGTDVTKPGNPSYTAGGNTQTAGQSYNEATITSDAQATDWATVNDDDKLAGALDKNGADINVWAKASDAKTKTYKVDFAWGPMKFEYDSVNSTKWDTATHSYVKGSATPTWKTLDGINNKVAITNHSNNGIDATFTYTMDTTTKFNDKNGLNNVVGNFFADNTKAAAAALVLTGTYSDANGTVSPTAVADKLTGNKIALATSDAYNDGTTDQLAGARNKDVFFAFSGTPDDGKGAATLKDFTKVGVINVTVTPNNDAALN